MNPYLIESNSVQISSFVVLQGCPPKQNYLQLVQRGFNHMSDLTSNTVVEAQVVGKAFLDTMMNGILSLVHFTSNYADDHGTHSLRRMKGAAITL